MSRPSDHLSDSQRSPVDPSSVWQAAVEAAASGTGRTRDEGKSGAGIGSYDGDGNEDGDGDGGREDLSYVETLSSEDDEIEFEGESYADGDGNRGNNRSEEELRVPRQALHLRSSSFIRRRSRLSSFATIRGQTSRSNIHQAAMMTSTSAHGEESVGGLGLGTGGVEGGGLGHEREREREREKLKDERTGEALRGWRKFVKRSKYYIPVLDWLPQYSFSLFIGDLSAALTIACLVIPQSMSYAANLAHLDAINGLLSSAIGPIVYFFLGTSRQMSIGPEAALSLISGQTIQTILSDLRHHHTQFPNPGDSPNSDGNNGVPSKTSVAIAVSALLTFETGILTFILGFLRWGFLDAVLSKALLAGFVAAVAVVIFIEQLIPMLGLAHLEHQVSPTTTLDKLLFVVEYAGHSHSLTLIISLVCLAALLVLRYGKASIIRWSEREGGKAEVDGSLGGPSDEPVKSERKWRKRVGVVVRFVPDIIIVVIIVTCLTAVFDWDEKGVEILGKVTTGDVHLHVPLHSSHIYVKDTVGAAVTIALIGYVESIVAGKQNASRFNYPISPNRELVAIGACNFVGSFVSGAIPTFGSITRSRLAGTTGARTQGYSLITGVVVLLATVFLLKYLYYLPKCVLGSIVVIVVFSLLSETPHEIRFFIKMRAWMELALLSLTFLLTIFWSLQAGIVVSAALSLVLVVHESTDMRVKILARVPGTNDWEPIEDDEDEDLQEEIPGVLIVRIREKLTFANAGALKERLRRLELYGPRRHHPSDDPIRKEAQALIFHFGDVDKLDPCAVHILSEVLASYTRKGVLVYITHLLPNPRLVLARAGLLDLIGPTHLQPTIHAALKDLAYAHNITSDSSV